MQIYEFTVQLKDPFDNEALADTIYGKCDDCTIGSDQSGRMLAAFDREAETLDSAVGSALQELAACGAVALQVTLETNMLPLLTA